jgi:hypothetical protein
MKASSKLQASKTQHSSSKIKETQDSAKKSKHENDIHEIIEGRTEVLQGNVAKTLLYHYIANDVLLASLDEYLYRRDLRKELEEESKVGNLVN